MVEEYIGVKFSTGEGAMKRGEVSDERIKEIVKYSKLLSKRGYAPENAGNISIRKGEGFIITATGSELERLQPDDFVFVEDFKLDEFELRSAFGNKLPSSETPLHAMIYLKRSDIDAIVHCHAFPKGVQETGDIHSYGGIKQANAVSKLLEKQDIGIAKGHGVFALGKSVKEAAERILKD